MSPLFFVRGGNVYPGNQQLRYAGQGGYYWSSRANSSASEAYSLRFWDSGVDPSGGPAHYNGYSLRCLIPTT